MNAGTNALLAFECYIENNHWTDFLNWKACRVGLKTSVALFRLSLTSALTALSSLMLSAIFLRIFVQPELQENFLNQPVAIACSSHVLRLKSYSELRDICGVGCIELALARVS